MHYGRLVAAAAAVLVFAGSAAAQTPTAIEQFTDWGAYMAEGSSGKVCFVASQPKEMQPTNVDHGTVNLFITRWPGQGVEQELNIQVGYTFRDGAPATVEIGSDTFQLYTNQDGAWVGNVAEENRLIQAMRAGSSMLVRATSQRGTNTVHRYSLAGISAALDRIARECS